MSLLPAQLTDLYRRDRELLAATQLPIVTVAGTFRQDQDIVLSRAHFSMALGVANYIWGNKIDPQKAWIVDPTHYISQTQWSKLELTEEIAKIIIRHSFLHQIKTWIDQFGRSKLPILQSITPPLLYLTEHVEKPIFSFHIAAGNILAAQGKEVIQVVTDPQVREEYLQEVERPNIKFCVFDDATRLEFLELASIHHKKVRLDQIIVTGSPIDPRIIAARKHKLTWRSGPLRLCITTGGLGSNKEEMKKMLNQLLPLLNHKEPKYQVLVYAGTQKDIAEMVTQLAHQHSVTLSPASHQHASLRLLHHPHLLEANELLIKYGFPWAHGFITKPSADMAYDAVAAGCFLLTLQEWGVWEEKVRQVFEQKEISRRAEVDHIVEQLIVLQSARGKMSWIEHAMNHAFGIEKLFLLGSQKIVEAAHTT